MTTTITDQPTATTDSDLNGRGVANEIDMIPAYRRRRLRWPWSQRTPHIRADLAERVDQACARIPLQHSVELYEAMDDSEIDAERRLRKGLRRKARRQRKRVFVADLAAENRDRRETERIRRHDDRQRRWHTRARASRRRFTSADAQEATLHRKATWSSLRLRVVMAVGLVWSAINVGRNLAPADGPTGPTWWLLWILSFGIEAMISVPVLEIMSQAATAARLGHRVERTKIIAFEATLLIATVSLNCGPHVATGNFGRAAEYSVAPIMVVVLMWLHAWLSARYATLIAEVTTPHDSSHTSSDQTGNTGADRREHVVGSGYSHPSASSATEFQSVHTGQPEAAAIVRHLAPVATRSEATTTTESVAALAPTPVGGSVDQGPYATTAVDAEPHDRYTAVAMEMVRTRASQKSVAHIVGILRLADGGLNANAVATQMSRDTHTDWTRSTVDRIIKCADIIGFRTTPHEQEARLTGRTA